MTMLTWQADEALPDTVLRTIGALRTYASRIQFFLGVPNTLMIGVLFYNDAPLLQTYIPTVYHWMAIILFGVVPAAIAIDRVLLHPAQIVYNAGQTDLSDRSPNFEETVRARERVDELHRRLDEHGVPQLNEGLSDDDRAQSTATNWWLYILLITGIVSLIVAAKALQQTGVFPL